MFAHSAENNYDEIAQDLDCRYISACEGAWRIFSFPIQHRFPPVTRLAFHLPAQQAVVYSTTEKLGSLFNKPRISESIFLSWMLKKKEDPFARNLKYSEFPLHFTYNKEERKWINRSRGFCVGRLAYAFPSQGELYYMRILLTKVKGPRNYEEIRTINNIVYPTFRAAYYVLY